MSKKFFSLDRSYWKQNPIVQILSTFEEVSEKPIFFTVDDSFLKNYNLFEVVLIGNNNYTLAKKSFRFLETPYKSRCSYYDSSQTIFNSLSHEHCVRQCLRYYCEIQLNCSCFISKSHYVQKSYYDIITQSDRGYDKLDICSRDQNYTFYFYESYSKICNKLCPIDCINDEYVISSRDDRRKQLREVGIRDEPKLWKFSLFWDKTKPLIINKETPVMTLTNYFCYIGGLFGIRFGINANKLFDELKRNYAKYYLNFINFSFILFYYSLEIIFIIKTKFLSIIRYFYSCFRRLYDPYL
jgi:hypothetical protein